MTGVDIIGALVTSNADLLSRMPAEQMKAALLPDGVALPALLVRLVSSVERQQLKRRGTVRTVDRVAVTVRAASYEEQCELIALVKRCCAGQVGDFGGGSAVSILAAGTGPDMIGAGQRFEQTQDFRVSYDAEA